jgi:S-adenosylmethionine hydrolase
MIVLVTDYGRHGPYTGQVEAVLSRESPKSTVIKLLTDLPRQNPKAAAYLLPAYAGEFPRGSIFFCVVDPGVGSFADNPVVMRLDNRWYIGPDNGIFDLAVRRAEHVECWKINWRPEKISSTFHGRDLYAPICAMIANGIDIPGEKIQWRDKHQWPDDLDEVVYIDDFGNCMTGLRASAVNQGVKLRAAGQDLFFANTFSAVPEADAFWYENSNGLVEIAINKGNAAEILGLKIGSIVEVES